MLCSHTLSVVMLLAHVVAIAIIVHAVVTSTLLLLTIVSGCSCGGGRHIVVASRIHVVVHVEITAHIVKVSSTIVSAIWHVRRSEVRIEYRRIMLTVLLSLWHGLLHLNLHETINTWQSSHGHTSVLTVLSLMDRLGFLKASSTPLLSSNVTKPKPRGLPVSRSIMRVASNTLPNCVKNSLNSSSLTSGEMPPTKIFSVLSCSSRGIALLGSI